MVFPPLDPQGLPPEVTALIARLQQQVQHQEQQLSERDQALAQRDQLLQRKDREIALREAKIEKINFELARLKRWTYGAKSEAMNAAQRRLFEETWVEDEASLREQLERLRREAEASRSGARHQAQASASQTPSPGATGAPAPRRAPPRARQHRLPGARLRAAHDPHR